MGSARQTSRCPAGRLRRAPCPASGAVCGPAATAQCGRAAPPTSPLGRRAARDPHSAWDDCSAESHGVSQPRSRLRGLRGGALAWARMSTARTAAAGGAPGWETGTPERPPPAARCPPPARASHWTRLPRSLACAPTREPSSVLNREWGGAPRLLPQPAARSRARLFIYYPRLPHVPGAGPDVGDSVNLTHVPAAPSDHAVVLSWG